MKFHEGGGGGGGGGGNFIHGISVLSLVCTTLIDIFQNVTICIKIQYLISEKSLRLRIFSSYFVKNTYFFALGRGPYMGPKYVRTKIPAILALQSCGQAYCIRAQKHLAALKQTSNKIRVLG